MTEKRDCSKKPYNKTRHDSKELVYMYAKICNMEKNTIIGRYKVLEYLGSGGFGIVYKCFDSVLMSDVAIKFLDPIITRDPKKFHRIKREINISRKITDDKIVKIYSMDKYYDVIYLVMEFIDGIPLSSIIKDKKYEWKEFRPILIEILHGLKLLHKNGIIHRDLKPGNIMVLKNDDIKIVDFGLAKEISDAEKTSTTEEFSGTAEFVSPEQVEGLQLDTRSDIYQVGLLIFKVLSDQHPLSSSSTMELLVKYLTAKPRKISSVTENLPKYAGFVTDKMLERDKSNRFNDVDEIIEILEKEHIGFTTQIASVTKKNKYKFIFTGLLILIISTIIIFNMYNSDKTDKIITRRSTIYAKNKFNKVLWKKDFAPDRIIKSFIMPVRPNSRIIDSSINKEIVFCLLESSKNNILPINDSINSSGGDSKVVILDTDGTIISKRFFNDFFTLQHYEYSKIFKISGNIIDNIDLNKDGRNDILFLAANGSGMFPYGLIYFKDNIPLVYTNPGSFNFNIVNSNNKSFTFTVFGTANLVSGLMSFSEIELKNKNVLGIPNLFRTNGNNFDGYTYFLPTNLKIIENSWKENGTVNFINTISGEKIRINKDHNIQVKNNGYTKIYSDPLSKLQKFNILFNTFYKEKTLFKDYLKAEKLINEIIDINFENPYLNSALYYFKGDIEIKNGKYNEAEISLNKGLKFFQHNQRIGARLSQIAFFKNDPIKSIEILQKRFSGFEYFGGLSNGTNLFKIIMYLSAGFETKAEEITAKVIQNSSHLKYTLYPFISFFNGKLAKSEKIIETGLKNRRAEFSNVEYRLLCSRIYILNNSNLKRAKFFLTDILKYSIGRHHLTEISLAYLLAKDGKFNEAEKMATLGLKEVIKYAKGDVVTKFWLFYEYYIYGKTMELAGNTSDAIKGYKNCISTTPHSYLAILSEKRLAALKTK